MTVRWTGGVTGVPRPCWPPRRCPCLPPCPALSTCRGLGDLDLLAAADHLIDMGLGGGPDGGRIVPQGTPPDIARDPGSATGPWLAEHLGVPRAAR